MCEHLSHPTYASLQPLMDNLDSQTYEIFEKDPIKYVQYEAVSGITIADLLPDCVAGFGMQYTYYVHVMLCLALCMYVQVCVGMVQLHACVCVEGP